MNIIKLLPQNCWKDLLRCECIWQHGLILWFSDLFESEEHSGVREWERYFSEVCLHLTRLCLDVFPSWNIKPSFFLLNWCCSHLCTLTSFTYGLILVYSISYAIRALLLVNGHESRIDFVALFPLPPHIINCSWTCDYGVHFSSQTDSHTTKTSPIHLSIWGSPKSNTSVGINWWQPTLWML